jgi:hypothetical protein|tara:strand:- start:94 stop:408 length:315 start_codon:yes stop_codon:yes gene_type:complete
MSINTKKPPQSDRTQGANKKTVSKNNTIMVALVEGSLTRFDAEGLGDHCLNSTISALSSQHGLEFPRRWVKVPNRFGGETLCKEYTTSDDDKLKINKFLEVLNG